MNTEEEIAAKQREETSKIREDAELLQSLIAHPGWKPYMRLIEMVGQNYNKTLNEPLSNTFECVRTEYAKGALMGLTLAASLPNSKINEAAELRKTTDEDE